jgi:simple sugar transport system ATP-binding protein
VRRERGIGYIPQDRQQDGLVLTAPLWENVMLGHQTQPPFAHGLWLDRGGAVSRTKEIIADFDVRTPGPDVAALALSGGNQQKLIIGREFELPPVLLLIAQPTRGVDIGAIEFIHRKIVTLRDSGCAVLLVSAELEEVTALADRLLVLHNGRIAGEVEPARATHEEIGLLMTGGHS